MIGASIFTSKVSKLKFWLLSIVCPVIPDFDVIGFKLGIPYANFWGHRGFFHSLAFAFLVAVVATIIVISVQNVFTRKGFGFLFYFWVLTASHGILDAMTSGGLGIALLAPFDNTRYFFPFTPIAVSPIGVSRFFSAWGWRVMKSELLWVWAPLAVVLLCQKSLRVIMRK